MVFRKDKDEAEIGNSGLTTSATSASAPVLLTLIFIIVVGTLFRVHLLAARSLWLDEAASVALVRLPWKTFWRVLWNHEANMVLYYLLLRGWIHLGDSEFAVRSLSVLFGVAAIPAIYFLGNRFLGSKAGLTSAALLALHSFHIRYSREARSYSLLVFLLILSTYFFLCSLESPARKKYWIAYVLVSVLAVYAHLFAVLLLVSQWLSLGFTRLRQIGLARIFWITSTFGLLVSPMAVFVRRNDRGQLDWIHQPTASLFLNSMRLLTGNFFSYPSTAIQRDALLILYALFWVLAVLSLAPFSGAKSASSDEGLVVRLVALCLIFPIGSTLFISFWKPVFISRFMIICVPAMVLLAGCGISKPGRFSIRLRWVTPLAVAVMIGLSLSASYRYCRATPESGWRSVTREILTQQQPGDVALFFVLARQPFEYEYYVSREMSEHGVTFSPTVVFPPGLGLESPLDLEQSKKQVNLLTKRHQRVWLVWDETERVRALLIRSLLPDNFRVLKEQHFSDTGRAHVTVALHAQVPDETVSNQVSQ
jgi:mannosyltransferase